MPRVARRVTRNHPNDASKWHQDVTIDDSDCAPSVCPAHPEKIEWAFPVDDAEETFACSSIQLQVCQKKEKRKKYTKKGTRNGKLSYFLGYITFVQDVFKNLARNFHIQYDTVNDRVADNKKRYGLHFSLIYCFTMCRNEKKNHFAAAIIGDPR